MERKRSFSTFNNNTNSFKKTLQVRTNQNKNKPSFTKEDSAILLKKYDARTVLKLLQEVASNAGWKINWKELVKKSSTGISSVEEYRILWRHLAYGDSLIDDDFQDLDDDSDLECERKPFPPISKQNESQAAACVQVMIESVAMSKSAPSSSTIEVPLPIKVASSNLNEETTISFPVLVDRPTRVNNDTNASSRKGAWSREEDIELQAAVQKWGEGNWTEMAARDDFTLNRTAAQLSKRWRILRNKADTN
ncbi:uncharacterized protein LOC131617349 [Vicia villosa]|uniref:uncharacterized protein LOC131617349 n=1 Tax=Vicia villosa TaxID=3911 RepID=UPI00273A8840|nr:uncharacterized protein LOC131617349 [Vicia villosa]